MELLRELAPEPVPPGGGESRLWRELRADEAADAGPTIISAGRSFHSLSGRAFWKDSDAELADGAGEGDADDAACAAGAACDRGGRFAASAVTLAGGAGTTAA